MLHDINQRLNTQNIQFTKPATITRAANGEVQVRIELDNASFNIEATSALLVPYTPSLGDTVLVTGESIRHCYIIGVIDPSAKANNDCQKISAKNGAKALCKNIDGREIISVENEQGYLLFEYDANEKKSKIYAPQGDLSLNALHGNIDLVSGKNIRCSSLGNIMLESATAAQIRVAPKEDKQSAISLSDKGIVLSSDRIGVNAQEAKFQIKKGLYEGQSFKSVLDHSKLMVGKLETVASRILERAKNVYRTVDELQQTKANRVRTLVDGAYQLKSETSYIESKKSVKIDAEKIHLG